MVGTRGPVAAKFATGAGEPEALVPDLDHYRGSFGGRAFPRWRGPGQPNLAPGLVDHLGEADGAPVRPQEVVASLASLAAILAHPAFAACFRGDLATPGIRVPLTAPAEPFREAVALGERVIWLHTYGERFADPAGGRPPGPSWLPDAERPKVMGMNVVRKWFGYRKRDPRGAARRSSTASWPIAGRRRSPPSCSTC